MSIYFPGSFTGNYQPSGRIEDGDCVIGSEFGYRVDSPGLVNQALARYIADNLAEPELKIFLPQKIADGLNFMPEAPEPTAVYEGGRTSYFGLKGIGTLGELSLAKALMDEYGCSRPIVVAEAHHVGRVAAHFMKKQGVDAIIPEGLPNAFDPHSKQSWTKGPVRWAVRESMLVPALHVFRAI